jgi:serine/threonine protein kinase
LKQAKKFGKYYFLERISVGGMAEVFKAKSFGVEGFEKLIAIKRILSNVAEDEDFISMFIDEAKIAVQLNHANIAQIFDLGNIDGSYFIALEYVHGKDLRTIWDRHNRRNLLLPIPMSVYIMIRMCEGLDYAHRKKNAAGNDLNIVHRDVSPQNILVSYEGEVKIIDFGIAKAADKASRTQAGILKGKFGYMSPEQVRGLPLDGRSDIFSAGIILYELLTGERLFIGESDFSTLEKVRNVEILPPTTYNRKIPDALEKIVLKALSKDPDDRFKTAYDMQEELQRFLIMNKSNFGRKDLAAYMKRAFKTDIERELERHKQYEQMTKNLAKNLPEDAGASFPSVPTEPGQPPPALPKKAETIGQPAVVEAFDDDEDDDIETVVVDARTQGLDSIVTNRRDRPAVPPPVASLDATPPPWESAGSQQSLLSVEEEDVRLTPRVPPMRPQAHGDASSFEDLTTGETTLAGQHPSAGKRSMINWVIAVLAVVAVGVFGFAVFKYLQQQGLLGGSASLNIQCTPSKAEIRLDGQVVASPVEEVKPGVHVLEAVSENYQPYREEINIEAGAVQNIAISMKFIPAVLELSYVPKDAIVKMNGKKVGDESPLRLEDVLPGTPHTFTLEHAMYVPQSMTWEFKPREKRSENVVLTEKQFDLSVDSIPPGAWIKLDGSPYGRTPTVIKALKATKQYQLELKRSGLPPWTGTIIYDGTPVKEVRPRLEKKPTPKEEAAAPPAEEVKPASPPRPEKKSPPVDKPEEKPEAKVEGYGTLRINSKPWGKVFIDGEDIGQNTPLLDHRLKAGEHTITIEFSTGETKTEKVTIFPDKTTTKIVKGTIPK